MRKTIFRIVFHFGKFVECQQGFIVSDNSAVFIRKFFKSLKAEESFSKPAGFIQIDNHEVHMVNSVGR
jgi:hypothetical protein